MRSSAHTGMRPLKVCYVAYSLEPGLGGIPRVARLMQRSLDGIRDQKFSTRTLVANPNSGYPLSRLGRAWQSARLLVQFQIAAKWASHFVYDSCQMAQLNCWPRKQKNPALTFVHGIEVWERAKPRWLKACQSSSHLVSNSDYTRIVADRLHGNFSRAQVCWLATESDTLPATSPKSSMPTALIVGRIESDEGYKGHAELMDAWPTVLNAVPTARLKVIGKGSGLESLRRRAASSGCSSSIDFEGFVPEERLEAAYLNAHVFVLPSRGEGFGIVYAEAMRCGLPVIASRLDAGQEVIEDGVTGYAVDQTSTQELAKRLIELLDNPDHARQMGQAGQMRWKEHFTPSKFIERFQAILRPFLDASPEIRGLQ